MNNASGESRKPINWSSKKEALGVIREVAFIVFVVLLFVWPAKINEMMVHAGITSAFSINFREELETSITILDSNQTKVEEQLDSTQQRIIGIRAEVREIVNLDPGKPKGDRLRALMQRLDSFVGVPSDVRHILSASSEQRKKMRRDLQDR
jgi:hypothetical protein